MNFEVVIFQHRGRSAGKCLEDAQVHLASHAAIEHQFRARETVGVGLSDYARGDQHLVAIRELRKPLQ